VRASRIAVSLRGVTATFGPSSAPGTCASSPMTRSCRARRVSTSTTGSCAARTAALDLDHQ
jgi:hypothetical protein